MKKIIVIFIIIHFSFCKAQDYWKYRDSLALVSREKADYVLSYFDKYLEKKIIFSFFDKDLYIKNFYLIIQNDNSYKEYYVLIDSLDNIVKIKEVHHNRTEKISKLERKMFLSKRKHYLLSNLILEEETVQNAFNTNLYGIELITDVPDAVYTNGPLSYFVLKDESGNRYGEASLYNMTLPLPRHVNPPLWAYLAREVILSKYK